MLQLPIFEPRSTWTPTPVSQLPSWEGAKRVSIDCETRDPDLTELGPGVRRGAYMVGVSFSIEDGPSFYLPMRHAVGSNLDPGHVVSYLRDQARAFKGSLGGANIPYDLDFMAEEGIEFDPLDYRDVQIAEPLINENEYSYSLEAIAARRGLPGKDESGLRQAAAAFGLHPKIDLWRMDPRHVGAYAEHDARLPLAILRRQERIIEEQGLDRIWALERKVLPVLVKMRRRGVRISFDRLDQVERWCYEEETKLCAEITRLTGVNLLAEDLTKSEAAVRVVESLGFKCPLTVKTKKPSATKDFLFSLDHAVCKLLLRARRINKVRKTFVGSVRRHAVKDRIHCTFNQLRRTSDDEDEEEEGTIARLSCVDPNLQQQPARDPELGPMWRSIYLPDEGGIWASNDYSQQEPRWLVHFAEVSADGAMGKRHEWPEATRAAAKFAAERYRTDPKTDNHTMTAQMLFPGYDGLEKTEAKTVRSQAKEIFLGRCYGMGTGKMAKKINLPTVWKFSKRLGKQMEYAGPEAMEVINRFDANVPFVAELARRCELAAKTKGRIITVGGRHCHFPELSPGRYDWCHKALNRLIQGSSADQTKQAMVDADAAGFVLQLQVHDELSQTVASVAEADRLAEIMRNCMPCNVPARVDVETGPSWGELH